MIASCQLGLDENPKNRLELFISLDSESEAIDFHDFLNSHLNHDLSQITAMEYFGYNSQNYMNNKEFLFTNENDVGIYLQIPIYDESMDAKIEEWIDIFQLFNSFLIKEISPIRNNIFFILHILNMFYHNIYIFLSPNIY